MGVSKQGGLTELLNDTKNAKAFHFKLAVVVVSSPYVSIKCVDPKRRRRNAVADEQVVRLLE